MPFELGRPLGVPNEADFQREVVVAALDLLTASDGPPTLVDYGVEAPSSAEVSEGWACPLNLPPVEPASEPERLRDTFLQEMGQMQSWYDLAREQRGSTTVGSSGLPVEQLAGVFAALLEERVPDVVDPVMPLPRLINLVADDIRALYAEGLTAQPGQSRVEAHQLTDWFYLETAAGRTLYAVKRLAGLSNDEGFAEIAGALAFPARLAGKG
ncbi:MAG: hypothetical protein HOH74_11030 [Gemmatimonadetes bacterium]|nr:hypothetical protein [Gemmatimonadota bacterium]